ADRYKLFVFEGGARQRLMLTADTVFLVPRLEVPLMIEMVPFVGDRRATADFHLNESLALDGASVAPGPAEPPVEVDPVVESSEPPAAAQPEVTEPIEPSVDAEPVATEPVATEPVEPAIVPASEGTEPQTSPAFGVRRSHAVVGY